MARAESSLPALLLDDFQRQASRSLLQVIMHGQNDVDGRLRHDGRELRRELDGAEDEGEDQAPAPASSAYLPTSRR